MGFQVTNIIPRYNSHGILGLKQISNGWKMLKKICEPGNKFLLENRATAFTFLQICCKL